MSPAEPSAELPITEFALPGPLRDRLVAAVLDGRKVSTTGLLAGYEQEGEPLPVAGQRSVVVDSEGRGVAVIEFTSVTVVSLGEVDIAHVIDEGEGHESVAAWRSDHERFWQSPDVREALGDPTFTVKDRTLVVLERFRMAERLNPGAGPSESG